jgi:hypothetical protein
MHTSRLPVRCDDSQQYPRKLSIKMISRFLLVVSTLCIIFFYECKSTIDSKSETPSLAPTSKVSRAGGEGKRRAYLFVDGEGHDEDLGIWRRHR